MNKSQLMRFMAQHSELKQKDANAIINIITDAITKSLSEGDQVNLPGFGTFALSYHPEKLGRNPKTGEQLVIPGANKIAFKPGKKLKEAI